MKVQGMKNQCLQDEGVGYSSDGMKAFNGILKVHVGFLKFPMEFPMKFMLDPQSGWRWRFHPT